jgi:hypothetical protein
MSDSGTVQWVAAVAIIAALGTPAGAADLLPPLSQGHHRIGHSVTFLSCRRVICLVPRPDGQVRPCRQRNCGMGLKQHVYGNVSRISHGFKRRGWGHTPRPRLSIFSQVAERHRGYTLAEQKRRMWEKQQPRERNSPHRVDVLWRIEGDAAEAQSGAIAGAKRDKAVSRLVKCNYNRRGKRPDRDRVEQRTKLLIHLTRCVSSPWRLDLDVGVRRGYRRRVAAISWRTFSPCGSFCRHLLFNGARGTCSGREQLTTSLSHRSFLLRRRLRRRTIPARLAHRGASIDKSAHLAAGSTVDGPRLDPSQDQRASRVLALSVAVPAAKVGIQASEVSGTLRP